jgi:hypothetical protein
MLQVVQTAAFTSSVDKRDRMGKRTVVTDLQANKKTLI